MQDAGGEGAADAGRDAALADVHADIRADDSIQYDLPDFALPERAETPEWLKAIWPFFEFIGPAIPYILIAVLIGLLLYFLWPYITDRLLDWRHQGRRALPDWRPEETAARTLLAEADALAAEGRYAEAAHILLHRSIEDIQAQRPDLVRPAFTSREIAAHEAMPADARGVFGDIARLVERGLFARRDVDVDEWQNVRAAYDRFVFAGAV